MENRSMVAVGRSFLLLLGTLSVAAAGIHFAVVQQHLDEFALFGFLFLGLAWFQAVWPILYIVRRTSTRLAWVGVLGNAGAIVVWVWSRTRGLPVGPEAGQPEAIGPLDVTSSALELVLVGLLLVFLVPRIRTVLPGARLDPRLAWFGALLLSAIVVVIASIALLAPVPMATGQ